MQTNDDGKNIGKTPSQNRQAKNFAKRKEGTRAVSKSRTASKATTGRGPGAKKQGQRQANKQYDQKAKKGETLKIIPLGGLDEVGKNITAYEFADEIVLVDCGLAFPSEEMLGIDIVIPDLTYVEQNAKKIKGLFVTHGHEDHIGAIPYLLKKVNVPIYATRFTMGLIERKLKEHNLLKDAKLQAVKPGTIMHAGKMAVEFIRVTHSIPEACSLAIHTPVGVVIQTGDYKVDYTPIDNEAMDLARFGELGSKGVLALLSDSTNSEKIGSSKSERIVGETFIKLFEKAGDRRILIASFASNVYRVQQAINTAERFGRKVALSGRSMLNISEIATELGYLTSKRGTIIDIEEAKKLNDEDVVIITTGSQGEPMAALSRMAAGTHRQLSVTKEDYIILSSSPVPGNEIFVDRLINDLMKLGAEVIHSPMYEVHVSGHAYMDEQKLMIELTNPRYFIPVHGEYKHLRRHAETALNMGIKKHRIILAENGNVLVTDGQNLQMSGKVQAGETMVDGLGVGDVGNIVLRDRKHLSEDGLMIIVATIDKKTREVLSGPDIVSRGFVYVKESEELLNRAKKEMDKVLAQCLAQSVRDWSTIKTRLRDEMTSFVFKETRRRPMILPILMEI